MSKQQQAPGDLELIRAFVNSRDIEQGQEQLAGPAALRRWLAEHDLAGRTMKITPGDWRRALEIREAIRALLLAHNDGSAGVASAAHVLDAAAARARVRLRFDDRGAAGLEPAAGGFDGAIGRLLAIVHASIADGTWTRLKACRDPACEWAFFDHTKNRSGSWCNMAVCGNRAKSRAYRQRRGTAAGA